MRNPTADMLRSILAQHENPKDRRLNSALTESDVVETIRLAIEVLDDKPPAHMAKFPRHIVERFARSVELLFVHGDGKASVYDLDGAREFYEAAGMTPAFAPQG